MFLASCGAADGISTRSLRDTVKISALDESRSRRSIVSDYTGQRSPSIQHDSRPPPPPPIAEEDSPLRKRNSSETGKDIRDIFFGARESVDPFADQTGPSNRAYVEDGSYSVGWVFDDESPACMRCDREFSMLRRRHHCRKCGLLVCHMCSNYSLPIQGLKPGFHRVCEDCFHMEQNKPLLNVPSRLPQYQNIPQINFVDSSSHPPPKKPPVPPTPDSPLVRFSRTTSLEP
mmetsp:Transcript_32095/g.37728  ORF Transcript_32095/g.37728 Transcript_32095/m.37728 type:complete len:231 (-) Transcript_32095:49-741(-)